MIEIKQITSKSRLDVNFQHNRQLDRQKICSEFKRKKLEKQKMKVKEIDERFWCLPGFLFFQLHVNESHSLFPLQNPFIILLSHSRFSPLYFIFASFIFTLFADMGFLL